jgi:hypothetical protein
MNIGDVTAVGTLAITALTFAGAQSRRQRQAVIRNAFDDAVASLSSADEERRMAGGVMLRRFCDPKSELGLRTYFPPGWRAPYSTETVSVIAAVLRGLDSGNFQKLLADGLAFAPHLRGADLQRTNLQNAYLGPTPEGAEATRPRVVDISRADFYRADLSGASLKSAIAAGAAFYEARLCHTTLNNADLRGANFFGAELIGANFDGARLHGARFEGARHVPPEISERLGNDGVFTSDEPVRSQGGGIRQPAAARVFISAPSWRTGQDEAAVRELIAILAEHGLATEILPRSEYQPFGQLSEVRRRIAGCHGAIIFGLGQLRIETAHSLPISGGSQALKDVDLPTPWNQIEAGLAFALDLPLLIVSPSTCDQGVFSREISEAEVHHVEVSAERPLQSTASALTGFVASVRARIAQTDKAGAAPA